VTEQSNSSWPPWLGHSWGNTMAWIVGSATAIMLTILLVTAPEPVPWSVWLLALIITIYAALCWPIAIGVALGVWLGLALL